MTTIPLEDTHLDIIGKAQRGLQLADAALCQRAGISVDELETVRQGARDASLLTKVARALGLNPQALLAIARDAWRPEPIQLQGLAGFNTPFDDMTVNAYLVWDPASREAIVFDTGADARPLLDFARQHSLTPSLILITHSHQDHIADLARLIRETRATAWINQREPLSGAQSFKEGKTFTLGSLKVETRLTAGHAIGGTTYVVHGLKQPVAVVGDGLFAGSMGGPKHSFEQALQTNRDAIFTLPGNTIIAPGHGPLTTVAEEKQHNPFYPLMERFPNTGLPPVTNPD